VKVWTYEELRTDVERDLDLEDEVFIEPAELMSACNDAISDAEAEIMRLHEDYMLTSAPILLVQGRAAYSFPGNIYANKVRNLEYQNGTIYYPIRRFKEADKFDRIADYGFNPSANQDYRWFPRNDSAAGGQKIILVPPAQESSGTGVAVTIANPAVFTTINPHNLSVGQEVSFQTSGTLPTGLNPWTIYIVSAIPTATTFRVQEIPGGPDVITSGTQSGSHMFESAPFRVTCHYIRQANRMTADSSVLDIPQFATYIKAFMKERALMKEVGHPGLGDAQAETRRLREQMLSTLGEMVPDNQNQVEMDLSHYEEMS
jgi:hypothetical protein